MNKIVITKESALEWLNAKYRELGFSTIEELEEYADTTKDWKLQSDYHMYILAVL